MSVWVHALCLYVINSIVSGQFQMAGVVFHIASQSKRGVGGNLGVCSPVCAVLHANLVSFYSSQISLSQIML